MCKTEYDLRWADAPVPPYPEYSASPEAVRAAIDRCELISFDIFGTLLCRTVPNEETLLRVVEARAGAPGFAEARIRAGDAADHETGCSPIRRIYEKLPEKFRALEDLEIETEARGLFLNPDLRDIWRYCLEKGKRIAVVSDMHLSSAALDQILSENGYRGHGRIYVSSEYGTSKRRNLFRHMLEEENVPPARTLHFGDNPKRDARVPRLLGMNICLVRSPQARFLDASGWLRFREYRKCSGIADLGFGFFARAGALGKVAPDLWAMLGGGLAGPLAVGFAERCIELAKRNGIKDLFFVARDGWLVKKAVERLSRGELSCHYVYAPRTYSYLLAYEKDDLKKHGLDRFLEMLEAAKPGLLSGRSGRRLSAAAKLELIRENWPLLDGRRAETDALFKKFVGKLREKLGGDRGILLVDGISGQNSAEKLYRKYWGAPVVALYFSSANADGKKRFAYCAGGDQVEPQSFFEFFLSAPTPPIDGISAAGEPIFRRSEQNDRIASVFRRLESGFDAFLEEYAALYSDVAGLFPVEEVIELFNRYLDTLDDREMALFEDALLPGDSAESRFRTMADKIYKPFFRIGDAFKLQLRKTARSFVLRWFYRGRSHTLFSRIRTDRRRLRPPASLKKIRIFLALPF